MNIILVQENSIKDLFSTFLTQNEETYIFSVPIYQREYSWREKQWEEFYDDLVYSYNKESMETDYWGNIIVYNNESRKEFELVDGQQRIITILLFIAAIGKIDTNEGYLPLKFEGELNDYWIGKIALKEASTKLNTEDKRHPFYQATKYFIDRIKEDKINSNNILKHLYKTKISIIIVSDELESNLLFGRINTRGISLSSVDLIKHKLFYTTSRRCAPSGDDEILKNWKKLLCTVNSLNISINLFVSQWFRMVYDDIEPDLYELFQKNIPIEEYEVFLEELLRVSIAIKMLKENEPGNDNKIARNLTWLLKISKSPNLLSVIMALNEQTFSKKRKINFFEVLTVYEFMRAISESQDFDWLDEQYLRFAKEVLDSLTEKEIFRSIDNLKDLMKEKLPDKNEFTINFAKLKFYGKSDILPDLKYQEMLSRYALYTLNNWSYNRISGYKTLDDDEYSIEHILAKKNASDGEYSREYLIGNLVVFEKIPNNTLGDIDLPLKIDAYKQSKYPQMRDLIYKADRKYKTQTRINRALEWEIDSFNYDSIENRGRYLADCFYDEIIRVLKT